MSAAAQLVTPVPFHFDEEIHAYMVNGVRILSTTQVLKGLGYHDYSMVNPEILEYKRKLGKLVHQAAHYWDEESAFLPPAVMEEWKQKLPDVVRIRLEGYLKFKAETGYMPLVNEHRFIGNLYGQMYGSQLDSFGKVGDQWWLVDIKNASGGPQRGWGIQTMSYVLGIRYIYPIVPQQCTRVIVQLDDKGGYKLHSSTNPKSKVFTNNDGAIWQACLTTAIDQVNHGLWKYE